MIRLLFSGCTRIRLRYSYERQLNKSVSLHFNCFAVQVLVCCRCRIFLFSCHSCQFISFSSLLRHLWLIRNTRHCCCHQMRLSRFCDQTTLSFAASLESAHNSALPFSKRWISLWRNLRAFMTHPQGLEIGCTPLSLALVRWTVRFILSSAVCCITVIKHEL